MILSQILQDDKVFIDTNIFLYAVFEHAAYGKSCRDFLKRVEKNEIMGYTSDLALNELFHKLMIAEIRAISRSEFLASVSDGSLPDAGRRRSSASGGGITRPQFCQRWIIRIQ